MSEDPHDDTTPAPLWAKLLLVAFPLAIVLGFMLLEAWIRG